MTGEMRELVSLTARHNDDVAELARICRQRTRALQKQNGINKSKTERVEELAHLVRFC